MDIGERIRTLREKNEMTQTELAQKIGSTKQTIYKYENGVVTNIPYDKLILLAKSLKTSPSALMGWEEKPDLLINLPDGSQLIIECKSPRNAATTAMTFQQTNEEQQILQLIEYFARLNETGKKKALDNIEDLTKIYSENQDHD